MEFYFSLQGLDFAPPLIVPRGNADIKNAELCTDSDPFSKSVCLVKSVNFGTGTGVVIAIRSDPIIIGNDSIQALVLTAGHVTGRILGNMEEIEIKFDNFKLRAHLIKEYSDWKKLAQIDEITGLPYVLPNDISLLGVAGIIPRMKETKIATSFKKNEPIWIVGIPKRPRMIKYCAPFLQNDANCVKKIRKAFCGFQGGLVKSDGVVMSSSSTELISGSYSATSGMSGGPVFSQNLELLGINVGGAALEFQYEVGQVMSLGKDGDWSSAENSFERLKKQINESNDYDSAQTDLKLSLLHVKDSLSIPDFDALMKAGAYLLQALAISYKIPLALDHNLAVSCTHHILAKLKNTVEIFKVMPNRFRSMEEFAAYLSI